MAPRCRAESMTVAGRIRGFIADRFKAALRPIAAQGPLTRSPTAGLQAIAVTCGSGPCQGAGPAAIDVARLLHPTNPQPDEAAMTPTPGLAVLTIVGTLAYLGLAVLGAGGLAAFFSHPARIALTVVLFALSGAACRWCSRIRTRR